MKVQDNVLYALREIRPREEGRAGAGSTTMPGVPGPKPLSTEVFFTYPKDEGEGLAGCAEASVAVVPTNSGEVPGLRATAEPPAPAWRAPCCSPQNHAHRAGAHPYLEHAHRSESANVSFRTTMPSMPLERL